MTEEEFDSLRVGWVIKVSTIGMFTDDVIRIDEKKHGFYEGTIIESNDAERINTRWGQIFRYDYYEIVSRGEPERRYNKLKGLYDTERI